MLGLTTYTVLSFALPPPLNLQKEQTWYHPSSLNTMKWKREQKNILTTFWSFFRSNKSREGMAPTECPLSACTLDLLNVFGMSQTHKILTPCAPIRAKRSPWCPGTAVESSRTGHPIRVGGKVDVIVLCVTGQVLNTESLDKGRVCH